MLCYTIEAVSEESTNEESEMFYAYSKDGDRLLTYDHSTIRLWKTSDFSEMCRHQDTTAHEKVVNVSFVSDSKSTFIVFYGLSAAAAFRVHEDPPCPLVQIVEHQRWGPTEVDGAAGSGHQFTPPIIDFASHEDERDVFVRCGQTEARAVDVSITTVDGPRLVQLLSSECFACPFEYSHAEYKDGNVLIVGEDKQDIKNFNCVGFSSLRPNWNGQAPLIQLEGSDGRFDDSGKFLVTWNGPTAAKMSARGSVFVYRIDEIKRSLRENQIHGIGERKPETRIPPVWEHMAEDGAIVVHAQLVAAQPNADSDGIRRNSVITDSKLVILCDVPWLEFAEIVVVDMDADQLDFHVTMSWTFKSHLHSPSVLKRWFFTQRPFLLMPDGQSFFARGDQTNGGSVFSLKNGHPLMFVDWSEEQDGGLERSSLDSSGRYLTMSDRSKTMHYVLSPFPTDCDGLIPNSLHSEPGLQRMMFLQKYDNLGFGKLLCHGLSFERELVTELAPLLEDDVFSGVRHRMESFGEENVIQVILSEDKTVVAFLLSSDPVRVEFWKVDELWDDMHALSDQCKRVHLPPLTFDAALGENFALFNRDEDGKDQLAVVCPAPECVSILKIGPDGREPSRDQTIRSQPSCSVLIVKVTADARKVAIMMEDTTTHVLLLDNGFATGRTNRPNNYDGMKQFIDGYVRGCFLHGTDDCLTVFLGWHTTDMKVLSVTLDLATGTFSENFDKASVTPNSTTLWHIPWMNKARTRAIVHRKEAGPFDLVFLALSGEDGVELRRLSMAMPRMHSGTPGTTPLQWKDTYDPDNIDELRIVCAHLALTLQERTPDYDTMNLLGVELSEANVNWMIAKFGVNLINHIDPSKKSLLHYAIVQQQFDCANLLLEYAINEDVSATLSWGKEDILGWAIGQEARMTVHWILEKLAMKCTSFTETAKILGANLGKLLRRYPDLIEEYLSDDKFCFELGRFTVPLGVFDVPGVDLVAMTTNRLLMSDMLELDREVLKNSWIRNNKLLAKRLQDTSGVHVMAVSKVICIEDRGSGRQGSILSAFAGADSPVSVFESEALKKLIDWKWTKSISKRFLIGFVLHVGSCVLFSVYAANYGWDSGDVFSTTVPRFALCGSLVIEALQTVVYQENISGWCPSSFAQVFLLVYSFRRKHHSTFTGFLASILCIVRWSSVLLFLQPFRSTGPSVSMIRYVLWDIRYFVLLFSLITLGFGLAFLVLFADGYVQDNELTLNSTGRAIETLFYATLGEFDPEVFRSSKGLPSIWISILFDAFLFIGAIVLLSLLIAILGDTYDKVKLSEETELVKIRAKVVGKNEGWNDFWTKTWITANRAVQSFPLWPRWLLSSVGDRVRKLWFRPAPRKKFFHYLVPAEPLVDVKDTTWHGKILTLVNLNRTAMQESEEKLESKLETFKVEVGHLLAVMNGRVDVMNDRMDVMNDRMAQMLEIMRQERPSCSDPFGADRSEESQNGEP